VQYQSKNLQVMAPYVGVAAMAAIFVTDACLEAVVFDDAEDDFDFIPIKRENEWN
jgi:hypothetical protein